MNGSNEKRFEPQSFIESYQERPTAQLQPPTAAPSSPLSDIGTHLSRSPLLSLVDLDDRQRDCLYAVVPGGADNVAAIYPLSPLQEGMLLQHLLNPKSDTYVLSALFALDAATHADSLVNSLEHVIRRHEALRTSILWEGLTEPVQVVHRRVCLPVEHLQLDPNQDALAQLREQMRPDTAQIDPRHAPMMKLIIASHGTDTQRYAILQIHHLECDHRSLRTIAEETLALSRSEPPSLPDPVSYRSYVEDILSRKREDPGEEFFRRKLGDVTEPTLAFGIPAQHARETTMQETRADISSSLGQEIRTTALRINVSPARVFHAAWGLVVSQTSGREDVVYGTVLLARRQKHPPLGNVIGMAINTVPLRLRLQGISARQLIEQTHHEISELVKYGHAPLTTAQRCSGLGHSEPIFNSLLNFRHSADSSAIASRSEGGIRLLERGEAWSRYPLAITIDDFGNKFSLIAHTDDRLSGPRILEYLSTALQSLTEALTGAPDTPVHELTVVPLKERHRLLYEFNETARPYPRSLLIHEAFEAQAMRTPDEIAVVQEGQQHLTYAELNGKANQLAWYLRAKGIGPDELVGLYAERSVEMLVGVLGIIKSGAAYVPLDPQHPRERIGNMIRDSAPRLLLIQEHLRMGVPPSDAKVIALDSEWDEIRRQASIIPTAKMAGSRARDLAYVIYTSGSTGNPKGVMVEHSSVLALWQGLERLYEQARPCSRVALNAPITFDASVQQLVQLLSGRTLYLVPDDIRRDPERMLRFLEEHEIDALDCTPSQLKSWVKAGILSSSSSKLQLVLVGGEPIDPGLWRQLAERKDIAFFNVYGPTECTVDVTATTIEGPEPHIGRPMDNRRVYILDHHARVAPLGVVGEIYIGGAGIARGYLNRPELTTERFLRDPFRTAPDDRMYRTGDLGKWRADGTIEYLGRNDQQVKLRGFRIELGEIAAQLATHASVARAAAVLREDVPGETRLIAYAIPKDLPQPPDPETLRAHLKSVLPDYMVPSAIVLVPELPLTPSGKLDQQALPAPGLAAYFRRHYEAPQGRIEEILARIWEELLHIEHIGRNDNFFELGGHSLLILEMLERLRRTGFSTDVRCIFEHPVLSKLCCAISPIGADRPTELLPNRIPHDSAVITPQMLPLVHLEPVHISEITRSTRGGATNVQDVYPLSPLQEGMLFHHLLCDPEGDPYLFMVLLSFTSRGVLDRFASALQHVIDRHDALRTSILWDHLPHPVQVVQRSAKLPVEQVTLQTDQDPIDHLRSMMTPKDQGMDLSKAPLMRLLIAPNAQGTQWYGILILHHIVCDNMSLDVILQEVKAHLKGQGAQLPDPVGYRNHILHIRSRDLLADHGAYFRRALADIDEPTLAFGLTESRVNPSDVQNAELLLDDTVSLRLRIQARKLGLSAATLFHSAWALVLAHVSGRQDVVFGSVLLGRLEGLTDRQRAVGLYINTLPLRVRLDGLTTREVVEETHHAITQLLIHENAPLALAQQCTGVQGSTPLFNSLLNYRHGAGDLINEFDGPSGLQVLASKSWTNYPVLLSVDERGGTFTLTAHTAQPVEPRRVTQYMREALQALVTSLETAPETASLSLSILPSSERKAVLKEFNSGEAGLPQYKLVHEIFEEQVRRTPHATAVAHEGSELTYSDLNSRANQLARFLKHRGVGPDQPVGICVERNLEMVIGLLAILKAGGAYLPLDPNYPADRLQHMLQDAAPRIVLTQSELVPVLPSTTAEVVVIDECLREIGANIDENLGRSDLGLNPKHLVYVIYTSGSTGRPKGTAMPHHSMVNLIEWHRGTFPKNDGIRVLQFAALSFDVAFQEIFSTLCAGSTLVLVDEWIRRDARALVAFLRDHSIHRLFIPPLMLQSLAESARSADIFPQSLQDVIAAGEQLRISPEMTFFFKRLGGSRLHNHYGPTETHVVTALTLSGDPEQWPTLPAIGRPIWNTQLYVLDTERRPAPIGVAGELYIGGIAVARGYLGKPDLTAQRFLPDCFGSDPEARLYRTGDLGRWRADGTIEYLGRNDFQIKIRGYRIEPGEIEAQLALHPQVKEAAVVAREQETGHRFLVAYITSRDGSSLDVDAIRLHVKSTMPEYMLPKAFVLLDHLPITPSGKLDRRSLPPPEVDAYARQQYEPPLGATETILATVWQKWLSVERVGRNDNFFDLGGHSISAMKVIADINDSLECSLRVTDIYQSSSLRDLADRIAGGSTADAFIELSKELHLELHP